MYNSHIESPGMDIVDPSLGRSFDHMVERHERVDRELHRLEYTYRKQISRGGKPLGYVELMPVASRLIRKVMRRLL